MGNKCFEAFVVVACQPENIVSTIAGPYCTRWFSSTKALSSPRQLPIKGLSYPDHVILADSSVHLCPKVSVPLRLGATTT
jgi:hypothetical protein